MTTPLISPGGISPHSQSCRNRMPISSTVRSRTVESRHRRKISLSRKTPIVVWVLPTSRASSISASRLLLTHKLAGREAAQLAPDLPLELPVLPEADEPPFHDPRVEPQTHHLAGAVDAAGHPLGPGALGIRQCRMDAPPG